MSFLGGEICSVRASYRNDDTIRPFKDADWSRYDPDILYVPSKNLAAIFELKSGAVIVVTSSYLYNYKGFILSMDAVFDDGAVTLTGLSTLDAVGRLTWTSNGRARGIDINHKKDVFARGLEYSFYKSIESFVNAYLLCECPETPGEQGLFNMHLEKAVSEASITGRRVVLDGDA